MNIFPLPLVFPCMTLSKLYPFVPSWAVQRSVRPQRTNLHVKAVTPEGAVPGMWKCSRGRGLRVRG
jgi:hypothetical protein